MVAKPRFQSPRPVSGLSSPASPQLPPSHSKDRATPPARPSRLWDGGARCDEPVHIKDTCAIPVVSAQKAWPKQGDGNNRNSNTSANNHTNSTSASGGAFLPRWVTSQKVTSPITRKAGPAIAQRRDESQGDGYDRIDMSELRDFAHYLEHTTQSSKGKPSPVWRDRASAALVHRDAITGANVSATSTVASSSAPPAAAAAAAASPVLHTNDSKRRVAVHIAAERIDVEEKSAHSSARGARSAGGIGALGEWKVASPLLPLPAAVTPHTSASNGGSGAPVSPLLKLFSRQIYVHTSKSSDNNTGNSKSSSKLSYVDNTNNNANRVSAGNVEHNINNNGTTYRAFASESSGARASSHTAAPYACATERAASPAGQQATPQTAPSFVVVSPSRQTLSRMVGRDSSRASPAASHQSSSLCAPASPVPMQQKQMCPSWHKGSSRPALSGEVGGMHQSGVAPEEDTPDGEEPHAVFSCAFTRHLVITYLELTHRHDVVMAMLHDEAIDAAQRFNSRKLPSMQNATARATEESQGGSNRVLPCYSATSASAAAASMDWLPQQQHESVSRHVHFERDAAVAAAAAASPTPSCADETVHEEVSEQPAQTDCLPLQQRRSQRDDQTKQPRENVAVAGMCDAPLHHSNHNKLVSADTASSEQHTLTPKTAADPTAVTSRIVDRVVRCRGARRSRTHQIHRATRAFLLAGLRERHRAALLCGVRLPHACQTDRYTIARSCRVHCCNCATQPPLSLPVLPSNVHGHTAAHGIAEHRTSPTCYRNISCGQTNVNSCDGSHDESNTDTKSNCPRLLQHEQHHHHPCHPLHAAYRPAPPPRLLDSSSVAAWDLLCGLPRAIRSDVVLLHRDLTPRYLAQLRALHASPPAPDVMAYALRQASQPMWSVTDDVHVYRVPAVRHQSSGHLFSATLHRLIEELTRVRIRVHGCDEDGVSFGGHACGAMRQPPTQSCRIDPSRERDCVGSGPRAPMHWDRCDGQDDQDTNDGDRVRATKSTTRNGYIHEYDYKNAEEDDGESDRAFVDAFLRQHRLLLPSSMLLAKLMERALVPLSLRLGFANFEAHGIAVHVARTASDDRGSLTTLPRWRSPSSTVTFPTKPLDATANTQHGDRSGNNNHNNNCNNTCRTRGSSSNSKSEDDEEVCDQQEQMVGYYSRSCSLWLMVCRQVHVKVLRVLLYWLQHHPAHFDATMLHCVLHFVEYRGAGAMRWADCAALLAHMNALVREAASQALVTIRMYAPLLPIHTRCYHASIHTGGNHVYCRNSNGLCRADRGSSLDHDAIQHGRKSYPCEHNRHARCKGPDNDISRGVLCPIAWVNTCRAAWRRVPPTRRVMNRRRTGTSRAYRQQQQRHHTHSTWSTSRTEGCERSDERTDESTRDDNVIATSRHVLYSPPHRNHSGSHPDEDDIAWTRWAHGGYAHNDRSNPAYDGGGANADKHESCIDEVEESEYDGMDELNAASHTAAVDAMMSRAAGAELEIPIALGGPSLTNHSSSTGGNNTNSASVAACMLAESLASSAADALGLFFEYTVEDYVGALTAAHQRLFVTFPAEDVGAVSRRYTGMFMRGSLFAASRIRVFLHNATELTRWATSLLLHAACMDGSNAMLWASRELWTTHNSFDTDLSGPNLADVMPDIFAQSMSAVLDESTATDKDENSSSSSRGSSGGGSSDSPDEDADDSAENAGSQGAGDESDEVDERRGSISNKNDKDAKTCHGASSKDKKDEDDRGNPDNPKDDSGPSHSHSRSGSSSSRHDHPRRPLPDDAARDTKRRLSRRALSHSAMHGAAESATENAEHRARMPDAATPRTTQTNTHTHAHNNSFYPFANREAATAGSATERTGAACVKAQLFLRVVNRLLDLVVGFLRVNNVHASCSVFRALKHPFVTKILRHASVRRSMSARARHQLSHLEAFYATDEGSLTQRITSLLSSEGGEVCCGGGGSGGVSRSHRTRFTMRDYLHTLPDTAEYPAIPFLQHYINELHLLHTMEPTFLTMSCGPELREEFAERVGGATTTAAAPDEPLVIVHWRKLFIEDEVIQRIATFQKSCRQYCYSTSTIVRSIVPDARVEQAFHRQLKTSVVRDLATLSCMTNQLLFAL